MNYNFDGIFVGYVPGKTLKNAFEQAQKRVEEATGLSFSKEEFDQAQKGLSPIFMGGLDNCLNAFAKNLLNQKQKAA